MRSALFGVLFIPMSVLSCATSNSSERPRARYNQVISTSEEKVIPLAADGEEMRSPAAQSPLASIDSNINEAPFKPTVPEDLCERGPHFWAVYKIWVSPDGLVTRVMTLKTPGPSLLHSWLAAVQRWRYVPYLIESRPTPFIHVLRVNLNCEKPT